jgi:hypothetical protein
MDTSPATGPNEREENMRGARNREPRALGWVLLGGGALMILFWSLYVSGAVDLGQHDPVVASFESAFVLADTVLGVLLLLAGWKLLRRRPSGPFLMIVAAAMSLYLGLLDLAFYAGIGLYGSLTGAAVFELSLNVICIAGGTWCLRAGWRAWRSRGAASRGEPSVLRLPRADDHRIGGAA